MNNIEITIFDIPEKEVLSKKSKRELDYEDAQRFEEAKKSSNIPSYHFNNFYEIDLYIEKIKIPDSNIISILCKWVIQYCIPLIDDNKGDIVVQNELPIYAFDISTKTFHRIPANKSFNIIGIKIPLMFIRNYDRSVVNTSDSYPLMTKVNVGNYGQVDKITSKYTQQDMELSDTFMNMDNEFILLDTNPIEKLKKVITYLKFLESYYQSNITMYVRFKFGKYVPYYINNGKAHWKFKRQLKHDDLINTLNKFQTVKTSDSYDSDVYLTMDINKMLYAYNVGILIGQDNDIFQSIIDNKKIQLDKTNSLSIEQNENMNKLLEVAKKRSIAFHKYNINDLTLLDDKQKKVIELEYTKFQKLTVHGAKKIQQLFSDLRLSFYDLEPSKLKSIMKEIESSIDSKTLNGTELMDGGICPHTYKYALITLENFGKPQLNSILRDQMINEYSLPAEVSGYFCKICGELLTETNITGINFGERSMYREEDPLQQMIWKEAMYVINSYVKFLTPMPIKPLVNSIASGLKHAIADEENKLYKSRMNTSTSIKDTLNLYANIYVYAALCSLMMNNIGKIVFGKDKVDTSNSTNNRTSSTTDRTNSTSDRTNSTSDRTNSTSDRTNSTSNTYGRMNSKSNNVRNTSIRGKGEPNFIKKDRKFIKKVRLNKVGGDKPNIKVTSETKMTPVNLKLYERQLLTIAINLIIVTKDATIRRLPNMNVDIIKQYFIKTAYAWTSQYVRPVSFNKREISYSKNVQDVTDAEPFYQYTVYVKKLSDQPHKTLTNILGRSLEQLEDDIVKGKNIYDTIVPPTQWKILGNSSNFDDLYDKYTYQSYINELNYRTDIYKLKNNKNTYENRSDDLLSLEKDVLKEMSKKYIYNSLFINMKSMVLHNNDFRSEKINLAEHYCPNGEFHKADAYEYDTTEYKISDIISMLKEKDNKVLSLHNFKNKRCGKCSNLIYDNKYDDKQHKNLHNIFKKRMNITAFYQYYDARCPKGDLHNITNGICEKCGFKTEDAVKIREGKLTTEYYDKFSDKFAEIEKEKNNLMIKKIKEHQKVNTVIKQETNTYDNTLKSIAEFSQLTGINYNLTINIGMTEGYKYDEIAQSKVNPIKELAVVDPQIYKTHALKIRNYIIQILRLYNTFINHENIEVSLEFKEILAEQRKIELKNISENMPKFNFIELDNKYKNISSELYANFLLNYLCDIFVRISKETKDKYKTSGKLLIKYFIDLLVTQEKMFSKPEPIIRDISITKLESDSEDENGVSGDEFHSDTEKSAEEFEDDQIEEVDETFDNEGYDVENSDDTWEQE